MLRRHASENPEYQPTRQERHPLHQCSRDRFYQYALPIFHANRRVRMAPPGNGHRRGKRRNDHTTGALYDSRYVQERGIRHGRYRQMASWPRRQSGRARLERPTPHRPWRSGI